jgi:hypothetical protein
VISKCIEFAQEAISGLMLLELAGVNSGQPPQVYDWGGGAYTVCQVDGQPATVPDKCFAKNMSEPNWSDSYVHNGTWTKRMVGVSGYRVSDGDLEGWTYSVGMGTPPAAISFNQVCPAPRAATTAPTSRSAATPASQVATTPDPSPVLQALAPSTSPSARTALASTGPPTPSPPRQLGPWLLLGGAVIVLSGVAAFNLRRRKP